MAKLTDAQKKQLALGVYKHEMIQFGEFTFKSGIVSPMYLNLRNFVSYPEFSKEIAKLYALMAKDLDYDQIGAIPYGAIPMASAMSYETNTPWLCARKESKEYGMGKDLLGAFEEGQKVLIVDDMVTDGQSKLESLVSFESNGLVVKDFLVMFDYDRGAADNIGKEGYKLHSMITTREAIDIIHEAGEIDDEMHAKVVKFLENK